MGSLKISDGMVSDFDILPLFLVILFIIMNTINPIKAAPIMKETIIETITKWILLSVVLEFELLFVEFGSSRYLMDFPYFSESLLT